MKSSISLSAACAADSWFNKQVLVTGGLGFIGSNLALRLARLGAKVTLIDSLIPEYGGNPFNIAADRGRLRVNIADVRDPHSMNYLVRGQDYLFNLAGQTCHVDSMRDPLTDLEINCRAQLSILEACRRNNPGIKIVFSSTRQVYGTPRYVPVDESHPLTPIDINGIHKVAGESYHLMYHRVHGVRACVLRLTNTYGPRMRVVDDRQTFLGIWFRRMIEGQPLLVFGDGAQVRDFNYVDDVVDALLLCAQSEAADGEVFNLGAPDWLNLRALAEMMIVIHGSGSYELVPFPAERRVIDIGSYYSDHARIGQRLGWKPEVGLQEGIARTLEYYSAHRKHYWKAA